MSIFGSLFTAVSGLTAQSDTISMISNNIANVSTVGYKRIDTSFESLVTTQSGSTSYSPGSVTALQTQTINQQGILQQSSSPTDVAISGSGFFVVKASITDPLASPLYTRAGSFTENSTGDLVNTAGYYLQGWPLDQNGNPPAGQANISSLVPVNVSFLGGLTQPTSKAAIDLNLNSGATNIAYPVPAGTTPSYTTAVQVYDSLGTGNNLSVNFTKMTSPTASVTGITNIAGIVGNMAGQVGTIASTDTFSVAVNGGTATTINAGGSVANMLAQINAISDPITGQPLVTAELDATGHLNITAKNIGDTLTLADVSGTPLANNNLGISSQFQAQALGTLNLNGYSATDLTANGFSNTDTFTVATGANPPTTITLTAGTTQLLADLNAVPGLSASIDSATGFLDLKSSAAITLADGSGSPLEGGVGGDLGMATALAATPPAADNLL